MRPERCWPVGGGCCPGGPARLVIVVGVAVSRPTAPSWCLVGGQAAEDSCPDLSAVGDQPADAWSPCRVHVCRPRPPHHDVWWRWLGGSLLLQKFSPNAAHPSGRCRPDPHRSHRYRAGTPSRSAGCGIGRWGCRPRYGAAACRDGRGPGFHARSPGRQRARGSPPPPRCGGGVRPDPPVAVIAARTRPSHREARNPVVSTAIVTGAPIRLPEASSTHAAR